MVIHMVMMEFSDQADAEEYARRFSELVSGLDLVKDFAVGLNVLKTEDTNRPDGRQWSLGMFMRFASREDFEAYRVDPRHQANSQFAQSKRTESAACTFVA